jgi:DNA-binding beta-propeller fold protein YncE
VIPTAHTAKSASTPKTGIFALLRGLLTGKGSGMSKISFSQAGPSRSLVVLCALAGLFALSTAAVAQAEPPKLVSYGSFSAHERAVGVAVGGSGDLFVSGLLEANFGPSAVVKLDPSGKLLSPPSPFGSAHYSGVAVNPTNGDVYVFGEEGFGTPATIFVYDPNTGALLSSFEVPAPRELFGVLSDVQIAADSAGNVYVPEPLKKKEKSPPGSGEYEYVANDEVLEYKPSECPALPEPCALTPIKTFTGSGAGALKEPTGVAVDASGNLWVADSGNNRIVELDSSGAPVEVNGKPVEIESEGVRNLALYEHEGAVDVFAVVNNSADPCGEKTSPCLHLVEYSSEGRQLADVGAGSFGEPGSGGGSQRFFSMVAVNEASGRVYVTDGQKETVWVFGPPTAPVVDRELTAEVGASEAKLGALVNPGGIQTSYRFEYGPTSAYGSSTPFPEGSVGEGVESHAVWASANGLAPGTTYHYRVVATNELAPGGIAGLDQTFTTLTAEQAACPNEQMRGGFSGKLPDCRAYELVTPPVTSAAQFDGVLSMVYASKAAADGEALTLTIREPRPGAPTAGEKYVARRGAGGWIAEDIMPLESYDGVGCANYQFAYAFSEQLTKDVIQAGGGSRASAGNNTHEDPESCNPEGSQVVSGEPVGYENLLVRENATGAYRLVNVTPPGVTPADTHFQAASADLSHVIFTETSPLAEGATYGVENLYEWDEGALRLVSVLPDGTAVPGSLAAKAGTPEHEGVVSSDGSHVLFTYGGALYDRIDGQRTVQIDEKQGGSGPSGGGSFKAATSDGSKVFFLDESKLTADSTAAVGEPDLYECALPEGASKCELADLTVAAAGEHAGVLRVTPLGGHDSSYVYFVAKGVLASNTREFTNGEGKTVVEGAEAGKQNLYLWNGSKTTFIAAGVEHNYFGIEQTSPDGKWLSFESQKSLTGYNNNTLAGVCGESVACQELFLYSAATGQVACASCNPTGEPPVGGGVARRGEAYGEFEGLFPTRRVLTDAGQVFFETYEALVPSDTNGGRDVYEYEGGGAHLISSGTSSFESNLEGVSESGHDVFFRSNQQLVPQDNQEGQIVTYDARVAGGFPAPASPPACTTADACRTPVSPQPSIYGAPSSQTFSGLGNLAPPEAKPKAKPKAKPVKCKKGLVKNKKGKCVRKKSKKQAKRASHNRRGK